MKIKALLLILFFIPTAQAAQPCLSIDWMYNLNIGNLRIDQEKLAGFCTEKTCEIDAGFITIRSHFDPEVAVIVKDSEITIRMPYQLSKLGVITSSMNLDEYNWKDSLKIDLTFLKHNGILNLGDSEIEKIANLAKKGENIFYCQGDWKQLGHNCRCDSNKEVCFECEGVIPLAISMPEELMPYDLVAQEQIFEPLQPTQPEEDELITIGEKVVEEKSVDYYFAIILFSISLILTIIIKYEKNKKGSSSTAKDQY